MLGAGQRGLPGTVLPAALTAAAYGPARTDPACEGAYVGGQPVNSAVQGGNDRGLVGSLLLRPG